MVNQKRISWTQLRASWILLSVAKQACNLQLLIELVLSWSKLLTETVLSVHCASLDWWWWQDIWEAIYQRNSQAYISITYTCSCYTIFRDTKGCVPEQTNILLIAASQSFKLWTISTPGGGEGSHYSHMYPFCIWVCMACL